jgi:hypothetical protein
MTVVVTRHKALVDYLVEVGLIQPDAEVLASVTADQIRGKHVVGVLPLHLAAEADLVTVVPLDLPAELRGVELSLDQVRQYAGPPSTFKVAAV